MLDKFEVTLPHLTGDEPRFAYVYCPDKKGKYPVLYMFDGHNVFFDEDATYGKSWGMLKYLEENQVPLIVAAVECNHSPDNGRLSEYSPFTFSRPSVGRVEGKGELTMRWFVRVFKPFVDANYPTIKNRNNTFIAGSSMGGLMSLYAVLKYNRVFSKAACLSPSVWVAPREIDRLITETEIKPGTVIYMDYGSRELGNHKNMAARLRKVANMLLEKDVFLTFRIVPKGEHCEASWEKQLPFVINTLLYK